MSEFFKHLLQDDYTGEKLDKYALKGNLEYLQDVVEQLDKPFIMEFTGLPQIKLESKWHDRKVYGIEGYLMSLSGIPDGGGMEKLRAITDEDIEWTEQRNKDYLYITYRKLTLKPFVQEAARIKLNELIQIITQRLDEIENEHQQKIAERDARQVSHAITLIHTQQMPTDGEDGYDGYMDVEVTAQKTNVTTRLIYKDIFDFGVFSFPMRVAGTNNALDRSNWTKDEVAACNWINEFGAFSKKIRM